MDSILISVVIPAYNIEKYIGRCLDSILNQTYKNLEIIVVNDGSTDNTGAIIDEYSNHDARIFVIHKDNGGVSSARVMGVKKSTGDFIGFVDGDDYAEPEMFEQLLNNALKYNADISHCGYQMAFPDGHIDLYYGTGKLVEQNHDIGLSDLIEGEFVEPGLWNKLYRKELVKHFYETPLWDSTIRINEDLLMNYILFSKAQKSIYEDIPFYHYVLRKGSAATTQTSRYRVTDPIKVIKIILEDSCNNEKIHSLVAERYFRVLMNVAQQNIWEKEAKKARVELKENLKVFRNVSGISKKVLMMSIGVAYMNPIYKVVRSIYDKKTGIDKKYNLE